MGKAFPHVVQSPRQYLTVGVYLLDLLLRDVVSKGLPRTPGVLITNFVRIDAVFDTAFPGYRKDSNIMRLVANLILSGVNKDWKDTE